MKQLKIHTAQGRKSPRDPVNYRPPTAAEIQAARKRANHSQPEAARVVGLSVSTWKKYELTRENGGNPMPFAVWASYNMLVLGKPKTLFSGGLPGKTHGPVRTGFLSRGRPCAGDHRP